jgi:hypothetical protein
MICVLLSVSSSFGQVTQQWVDRFDGIGNDYGNALALDAVGNVYVAGTSYDILEGTYSYLTRKIDPTGSFSYWTARFHGPVTGDDIATDVAVDSLGNVFVAGHGPGTVSHRSYYLVKYDSNGNQLWVRETTDSMASPGSGKLAVDLNGNVVLACPTFFIFTGTDWTVTKYDTNGNILWLQGYSTVGVDDKEDIPYDVTTDSSGNVYVTGTSDGGPNVALDCLTIKYSPQGTPLWEGRYHNSILEAAYSIAVSASGEVFVAGYSGSNYVTIKYDSLGNQLWVRHYNGPGNGDDAASSIAVDPSDNVYVTGSSFGVGTAADYATLKYDSNGTLQWIRREDGGFGVDQAYDIGLDQAANVYVTGSVAMSGGFADYRTIKYDTNGTVRWSIGYGAAGQSDIARALAVTPNGFAHVTGESFAVGGNYDLTTIKYVPSEPRWPSAMNLPRGVIFSGGLSDLQGSDNQRLVMKPGVVLQSSEAPIQLIVYTTAPDDNLSALEFSVEGHCSTSNVTQKVFLYNFDTNSFEMLFTGGVTTTDSIASVSVSVDAERFIGPNQEMRSLITYKPSGPILVYPWLARVDETRWTLTD